MKLLVINNLASGYGDGAIYDFIRSYVEDGDEVVIRCTDGSTEISKLLPDANQFDIVVAAGGDGTVATVAYFLANTGIPVLPFPAGTANLLAMNLHSPTEPHGLAQMTRSLKTLDFDIGEIHPSSGPRFGFSIIAGAGYDATIMRDAASAKHLLGPMAYFSAAFANPTPQHSDITLEIDGETFTTDGIAVLIVNFARIQFDIAVVQENLPRDGMFDVVVLHTKDAWSLIPLFITRILDKSGESSEHTDKLEVYQGKQVTVMADPPLQMQYDGEATDFQTPFSVKMIHNGARFIVSDECLNIYS